jgi:membrane-bound inhibitor of C-type lysozyme
VGAERAHDLKANRELGKVQGRAIIILVVGTFCLAVTPAAAQSTITLYQCDDGSQFAVAFYYTDTHAHIQLNGKSLALRRWPSLSGARFSGSGVTLRISKTGATLKDGRQPVTTCNPVE